MSSGKFAPGPTKKKKSDLNSTEPKGLVLNKRGLKEFKSIAYENADVEFLYLRENLFKSFDPYITLDNLKVLDLSLNSISSVEFLPLLRNLRHLYLTGNNIDKLEGFSNLQELETLCLSSNFVSSFEGLQSLPNLRVLSLNYNSITSFKHFPFLPSLYALNLVGNPIYETPCYRKMAIAVSSALLSKVDGRVIEDSEREDIDRYRGKIVYCITDGFIVENESNLEQLADQFLLDLQRDRCRGVHKPLQLQSVSLSSDSPDGVLREGIPIHLNVCLQDTRSIEKRKNNIFHSRYLCPVAFKVSGNATEVFVVGSVNQWTDSIPLERCDDDDGVYFQTTLYLPPGEYEYRYVVDGVEKISETSKTTSKYKQGICNIYKVTETVPEDESEEHETILHIRWLRNNRFNGFDYIHDENSLTYTPTADDVDHCLRAEVLVYVDGDFNTMFFDITTPIHAGNPTCTRLDVEGVPAEGNNLQLRIEYSGGREGESTVRWFRVLPTGEEIALDVLNPRDGYSPSLTDVGHRLKVEYVPMRDDWVAGNPVVRYTSIISAGVPVCRGLSIRGKGAQNEPLTVEAEYSGGIEGNSSIKWYRFDESKNEYDIITGEVSATYIPTLNDVGKRLAVEYTPVSRDGLQGEPNRTVMEEPILPGVPQVKRLAIVGPCEEQHRLVLEFDYFGGYQGTHLIQWYRRDGSNSTKVGKPNSPSFTVTAKEVGHFIEVVFTPVRADGFQGEEVRASTENRIQPAPPQIIMFELSVAETKVGEKVNALVEYLGGEQGESVVEWFRSLEDKPGEFELITTGPKVYTLQAADAGRYIRVVYTPVRKDGVRGEPKTRMTALVERR
eukprot:PhF_6_TR18913/c0_g1_i1/m.27625